MKRSNCEIVIRAAVIGFLVFFLGIISPAYSQQERHQEQDRNQQDKQQENQQDQLKGHQQEKNPQDQRKEHPQEKNPQDQRKEHQQEKNPQDQRNEHQLDKNPQHQNQRQHVQQSEQHGMWQKHRARNWQAEHRTWKQRGGYHGYRIPEDRFRGYFGQEHGFFIFNLSLEIFGGYPRFQYGGFWFTILDPWPENWSDGWYQNDDMYINYSYDGYYLYNRRHPGAGVAISISTN